jgi:hypothetical protein
MAKDQWTRGSGCGQNSSGFVHLCENFMGSFPNRVKAAVILLIGLVVMASGANAQGNYATEGGEYNLSGTLPGEQMYPKASIRTSGGYVVWQDKYSDGQGLGISARKLDSSLSSTFSSFPVNQVGADDQERPSVSMLNDGGAVFVWEGGKQSFQHIYARFLSAAGTWITGDVMVNTPTNLYQMESSVTTLTNGNVVVVWSSFKQVATGSMRDVYAQILSPTGSKIGGEIQINSTTAFNQRSATIAPLSDGRFVVVWVSEQQMGENRVDLFAKIYSATGVAATGEVLVNTSTNLCSNPTVAASSDGGFCVAWTQKDPAVATSWDIYARPMTGNALGGVTRRVNSTQHGDQHSPQISSMGTDYLVVWTSMGQDGSREGVYSQFLRGDGSLLYGEMRANTTTAGQQMQPTVASDGVARFLTAWTSFVGGVGSFDLYAQRYVNTNAPLPAPSAPSVSVLSSSSLGLGWPSVLGFNIANYEVYADGSVTATAVTTNVYWSMTNLATGSTHSFQLAYVLNDGRRSPKSATSSGTTYLYPFDWYGIPYDWMVQNFGGNVGSWPLASVDTDGDGASNLQEFLQGTNPNSAASVLKYNLRPSAQGMFLDWNTQPGLVYQVQTKATPTGAWVNLGGPRFAAGTSDTMYVGGNSTAFFRIGRVR